MEIWKNMQITFEAEKLHHFMFKFLSLCNGSVVSLPLKKQPDKLIVAFK